MTEYELKAWNPCFSDVWDDRKLFEIRWNNMDYKIGDILKLMEYDPEEEQFLGRYVRCEVIYIMKNPSFVKKASVTVKKDFVIMSIKILKKGFNSEKIEKIN
jgi:hypothetical protein